MIRKKNVRKQQILLYQGEAAIGMHHIDEGIVRAYSILPNGSEVNIALFGPGEIFPAEAEYDESPAAMFYYEALTDCIVTSYTGVDATEYTAKNIPTNQQIARKYVAALLHVNALGQSTAQMKLAHILRYLSIRFGEKLRLKGWVQVSIKLTQQDIANLSGMSRETVSIELSALKDKKIIVEKTKLYSIHLEKLNKLIGDEING